MANNYDITNVRLNGLTIGLIKLNGNIVYPIGEEPAIDFPYDDCDCYIVYYYRNSSSMGYDDTISCTVIDATQPYSINGRETNEYSISGRYATGKQYELKLINLKPHNSSKPSYTSPIIYHQLRLSKTTDLSYLFKKFGARYSGTIMVSGTSWSPQYFEFHPYPTNMSYMFMSSVVTDELMYQFIPYFPNTSKVTDMQYMFYSCKNLDASLNDLVAKFDTSSATNMNYMFSGCDSLTSIDLSNWDVSNVTNMGNMFLGFTESDNYGINDFYSSLVSVDTTGWKPCSVTNMSWMFYCCAKLTTINGITDWDTSSVTNMRQMFYFCRRLQYLDLSKWDTSKVTDMNYMFDGCTALKELDIESWDTSNVSNFVFDTFGDVSNCTIYIGEKTFATTSNDSLKAGNFSGGTNNTFIRRIKSIDLVCNVEDATNVTNKLFTITSNIIPYNHLNDLEVIYDKTYLETTDDYHTFRLKNGSQGQTLDITYRSKYDNSISKTITITVADELTNDDLLVDFTQETAPTLPTWIVEETKGTDYYFTHGTYNADSTIYGLVENVYPTNTPTYWNCYKVVAPVSGKLCITLRAYNYGGSYPFVVHSTKNATQPSYSSSTNRVANVTGSTYRTQDGKVNINVVAGETYYIHIQHRRYATTSSTISYCSCIRSFEIV